MRMSRVSLPRLRQNIVLFIHYRGMQLFENWHYPIFLTVPYVMYKVDNI